MHFPVDGSVTGWSSTSDSLLLRIQTEQHSVSKFWKAGLTAEQDQLTKQQLYGQVYG
jgi:hypothetical protein